MEVKGLALLWTYNNNKSHGSVHGGGIALHCIALAHGLLSHTCTGIDI